MSTSKQVKVFLKAAKAAVAKKDFQETEKQCQVRTYALGANLENYVTCEHAGSALIG